VQGAQASDCEGDLQTPWTLPGEKQLPWSSPSLCDAISGINQHLPDGSQSLSNRPRALQRLETGPTVALPLFRHRLSQIFCNHPDGTDTPAGETSADTPAAHGTHRDSEPGCDVCNGEE
jgi:hypothetical protein